MGNRQTKKMRSMFYFFPLLLFGLLVFFLWKSLNNDPYQLASPLVNKPIVDFVASDLLTEHALNKKLFLGHWSLLVVWASWCVTCSDEQDFLLSLKKNKQLAIVGLNYRDDLKRARSWLKLYGNPYQNVIFDPRGLLAIDLGVYGVPESFLIDPSGIIRYKQVGPLTKGIWNQVVRLLQ